MKSQQNHIDAMIRTLQYFLIFKYPLTVDELHRYHPHKIKKSRLYAILQRPEFKKKVHISKKYKTITLKGKEYFHSLRVIRKGYSKQKCISAHMFARILGLFPWIRLVGLSGSVAVMNADDSDDIDFFIVSAPGCIWTSRFTAIFLAKLLRKHRSRGKKNNKNTYCLNLFFDESYLSVRKEKRNEYIAHEVVQMLPLYKGAGVYESFLYSNLWVKQYFPNNIDVGKIQPTQKKGYISSPVIRALEGMLKRIQLSIMSPHISHEHISDEQLWFFPQDFEKRIRRKVKLR